jgi:hypothetical protein
VGPFYRQIITQINNYHQDLQELQIQNKLIKGKINKVVLVSSCSPPDVAECALQEIDLREYKPEHILAKYFEHFKELSYFLKIRSGDYGVVRLGLLNPTLKLLSVGKGLEQICDEEKRAEKTIKNRLSVAMQIGLINKHIGDFFLTELGSLFVQAIDPNLNDRLSEEQSELLANFVKENPFYSSITYTILSFVETIFVLSKSAYPVEKAIAQAFFVKSVGKEQTWRAVRAQATATYIFSNYACDLGYLAMVGKCYYITPKGIQAILLLQMNRSIKLIESQQ